MNAAQFSTLWRHLKNMRFVARELKLGKMQALQGLGFERIPTHNDCSCMEIFVHPGLEIVVKRNYKSGKRNKFCVPSIEVPIKPCENEVIQSTAILGESVCIQPLVDTSKSLEAFNILENEVSPSDYLDLHPFNCGFYLGKPYLFDW